MKRRRARSASQVAALLRAATPESAALLERDLLARPLPRRESELQRDVEWYLSLRRAWWVHLSDPSVRFNRPGIPDLIACYRGRFIGIELKSRRGKLRPAQACELQAIGRSGGAYVVARSVADVAAALDQAEAAPDPSDTFASGRRHEMAKNGPTHTRATGWNREASHHDTRVEHGNRNDLPQAVQRCGGAIAKERETANSQGG